MKFCWSTLKVKNMEESLSFYKDIVGLEIKSRFEAGPVMEIAFLGSGETKIELICDKNDNNVSHSGYISLGFEIDSVVDMMKYVKQQGLSIHSGPFEPNSTIKFFYVLDPNGLKIQFIESK